MEDDGNEYMEIESSVYETSITTTSTHNQEKQKQNIIERANTRQTRRVVIILALIGAFVIGCSIISEAIVYSILSPDIHRAPPFDDKNSSFIQDTKSQLKKLRKENEDIKTKLEENYKELSKQVNSNEKRVALTACASNTETISNAPVKFQNVLSQTGINSIASFKSTGKFTCEIDGLYFISAYIRSTTNDYEISLEKNDNTISKSATSSWTSFQLNNFYSTSPIVAVVDAVKNDTLYIKTNGGIYVQSITIVKIK